MHTENDLWQGKLLAIVFRNALFLPFGCWQCALGHGLFAIQATSGLFD